jgi:hypothetical protein
MKRNDVLHILQKECQELIDHYPISALYVFGSVARDEAREDSDVDILVEFSQPIGLFQFIDLQQKLEALLGSKVDLGTRRSLKPRIKKERFVKQGKRQLWMENTVMVSPETAPASKMSPITPRKINQGVTTSFERKFLNMATPPSFQ